MKQDSEEYYRILDNNFRPYYSKLPNYDPAAPYCRPKAYLSTDWQNDKFAGHGSFTNLPVGSGDCAEHFEALREGMGENRGIWFAGEHTSPPGGLGTVTGAYWSGEEVAKRVARRHGLDRPSARLRCFLSSYFFRQSKSSRRSFLGLHLSQAYKCLIIRGRC
jgi:hypothetical protein